MSLASRLWPGTKIEVTTSRGTRNIESQKDGFEVDVIDIQSTVPFSTNGLRDPTRMKSIQGPIHPHIAFAMRPVIPAEGMMKQTTEAAEGIIAVTNEESTEGLSVNPVEGKSGETAKETTDSITLVTAKDSTEGNIPLDAESVTAEIAEMARKVTTGESTKDSRLLNRAEGTSGVNAEDSTGETTQAIAETTTVKTTTSAYKAAAKKPTHRSEATFASVETAVQTTANIAAETSEVDAQGNRNVLLVRTVWSRKAFFWIVFASIITGAVVGIVIGILTKSVQNGAAVGSIVFGLIHALQCLVLKKNL
ncbi:hypothetical protein RUND412_009381 [Rhizina undulata]